RSAWRSNEPPLPRRGVISLLRPGVAGRRRGRLLGAVAAGGRSRSRLEFALPRAPALLERQTGGRTRPATPEKQGPQAFPGAPAFSSGGPQRYAAARLRRRQP